MKISYIINTNASDRWADGKNPWRSAGYSKRYELLKERVLPAAMGQSFDEIIVAGCFEEGEGYKYINVPPRYRDRRDALWQREAGARHATGDVLVFGHDDHSLASNFHGVLYNYAKWAGDQCPEWDLLIPKREHGVTGAELNNGKADDYVGSHVIVMKRWLWAQCPWNAQDNIFWDKSQTRIWKEAGGILVYANDLIHIDIEAAENET